MPIKRRRFVQSALAGAATAALPLNRLFAQSSSSKIVSDINAVTGSGGTTVIEKAVLQEVEASLTGGILLPSSEGYDQARKVWNGMIDKRPALIVRCQNSTDVASAVNLAREYDLLTAVRGGGHNIAGKSVCDGGIVIDCSQMRGVRVDPEKRSAYVEPGVLLGEVDVATQAYGLATPAGVVSHTGAAGLTLGGGFGRLSRTYGMTCDNVRYFDVVTADGQARRANVSENPDLFWGLRGGGGNFGVVTQFEYQLHPVGTEFLSGGIMHPIENAKDVVPFWAEVQAEVPDELQLSCTSVVFPEGQDFKGFVVLSCFYVGDPNEGEKVLAPIRAFGKPMNDGVKMRSYVDIQKQNDANVPHGQQYYQKAGFFSSVEQSTVDAVLEMIASPKPFQQTMVFSQVGGVIKQIDPRATAYPNREAQQQLVLGGGWPKPVDEAEDWIAAVRGNWDTVEPFTDGFYVNNMMGDESDSNIRSNYRYNYERLVELKNTYDPTNLFRLNANVAPTV